MPMDESLEPAPRRPLLLRVVSKPGLRRLSRFVHKMRHARQHRRLDRAGWIRSGYVATYWGDRTWVAVQRPSVTDRRARTENLATAAGLLEKHRVPYFAIPSDNGTSVEIGVPDKSWNEFVDALRAEAMSEPLYIGIGVVSSNGRPGRKAVSLTDEVGQRALSRQSLIDVFKIYVSESTDPFLGRPQACRIQRWEETDEDGIVAPVRNTRASYLSVENQVPTRIQFAGVNLRTYMPLKKPHIFTERSGVDAVYMWVDGNDPIWREKKNREIERLTGYRPPDSVDESRFRDNGELRYSLRSINEFCPWVRRIILVSDDQRPEWLDAEDSRIRIVSHRELFGQEGRLPTFNSHAIGSRLHHIPGLSEKYIILNDDVFVGRPIGPEAFFMTNGVSKFFLSKSTLPYEENPAVSHEFARRNVVDLIESEYGVTVSRAFFHAPIAQRRSFMMSLEGRFPDVFLHDWNSQFRSDEDFEVNSWLYHYAAYMEKEAIPAHIRYDYFDLSDEDTPSRLRRLARRRDVSAFCINDSPDALERNVRFVRRWLPKYFPNVAPWEGDLS